MQEITEEETQLESRDAENWIEEAKKIQAILIKHELISIDDDLIKNDHFWFVFLLYYREHIKTNSGLLPEYPTLAAIDVMVQFIEDSSALNTFKTINKAEIDELTQIWRRRTFKQRVSFLQTLVKEPEKDSKYTFAVYYIDIDFFKKVNDEFGHDMGDIVLQIFAKTMQENSRSQDSVFRWGGEEFVILKILRNENLSREATKKGKTIEDIIRINAEYFRSTVISQMNEILQNSQITNKLRFITFSMGITTIDDDENSNLALTRADQALDSAKKTGRNKSRAFFLKQKT